MKILEFQIQRFDIRMEEYKDKERQGIIDKLEYI